MKKTLISFVALAAMAAAATGPERAEYLKDPPPDDAGIPRAAGVFPESGSDELMPDGEVCRRPALWTFGRLGIEQDNENVNDN
ncbi:MAG: hypothetical protein IJ634_07775 [Bacteroidales bacterium]|nr:hypothetical protein [Bacteroidales bacterium]